MSHGGFPYICSLKSPDMPLDTSKFFLELLETLSITRARKGYSPRETGAFLFSLKNALIKTLSEEIKDDPKSLYDESLKISNLMDELTIASSFQQLHKLLSVTSNRRVICPITGSSGTICPIR